MDQSAIIGVEGKSMMNTKRLSTVLMGMLAVFLFDVMACDQIEGSNGSGLGSAEVMSCSDGIDNDENGFADCSDSACEDDSACQVNVDYATHVDFVVTVFNQDGALIDDASVVINSSNGWVSGIIPEYSAESGAYLGAFNFWGALSCSQTPPTYDVIVHCDGYSESQETFSVDSETCVLSAEIYLSN